MKKKIGIVLPSGKGTASIVREMTACLGAYLAGQGQEVVYWDTDRIKDHRDLVEIVGNDFDGLDLCFAYSGSVPAYREGKKWVLTSKISSTPVLLLAPMPYYHLRSWHVISLLNSRNSTEEVKKALLAILHKDPNLADDLKLLPGVVNDCHPMAEKFWFPDLVVPGLDEEISASPKVTLAFSLKDALFLEDIVAKYPDFRLEAESLYQSLENDTASNPIVAAGTIFKTTANEIAKNIRILALIEDVSQLLSNIDRLNILRAVSAFPGNVYLGLARLASDGDVSIVVKKGKLVLSKKKSTSRLFSVSTDDNLSIRKPDTFSNIFNGIRPGDISICNYPSRTNNVFSERLGASMFRGATTVVPHNTALAQFLEHHSLELPCFRNWDELNTRLENIYSGKFDRKTIARQSHEYASSHREERFPYIWGIMQQMLLRR